MSRFQNDKTEFWNRVSATVDESLQRIHDAPSDPNCTLIFTEPKPAHDDILQKVLFRQEEGQKDVVRPGTQIGSANEGDRAEKEADFDEDRDLGKEVIKRDDDEMGVSRDYGSASSDFGLSPSALES